jgi:hypothetical protein
LGWSPEPEACDTVPNPEGIDPSYFQGAIGKLAERPFIAEAGSQMEAGVKMQVEITLLRVKGGCLVYCFSSLGCFALRRGVSHRLCS